MLFQVQTNQVLIHLKLIQIIMSMGMKLIYPKVLHREVNHTRVPDFSDK